MTDIINARGLFRAFGGVPAIDHVDLDIPAGAVVGLIGPNGAGKTTLLRALLGLTAVQGELSVLGRQPVREHARLMEEVSFIADTAVLPRWIRVEQLLDAVNGLHPRFDRALAETFLAATEVSPGRRVGDLSKGMTVQLHLALVMAIDARLLIMDEPTLGLDILFRRQFFEQLLNDYFDEQRTILISTHQVEEVENILTHVVFMDHGRIVLNRPLAELESSFVELHCVGEAVSRAVSIPHVGKQAGGEGTRIIIRGDSEDRSVAVGSGEADDSIDLPSRPATRDVPESAWDFELDWAFSPPPAADPDMPATQMGDQRIRSLNPLLNTLHNALLLLVLMIAVAQYLLGALYDDRKDRSILFWRSLPVSEWESVLSKLAVALVVAPAILIAISILLQVVTTLLAMLMVWRLDMAPMAVLADNLAPARLLVDQIGGWLLSALWLAPTCAWLLLASAAARRSPFLFAVVPVIGAVLLESTFLRSSFILTALGRHMPHLTENDDGVGFYLFGPDWAAVDWLSLSAGLIFAALATALAVYLRRHRWEI